MCRHLVTPEGHSDVTSLVLSEHTSKLKGLEPGAAHKHNGYFKRICVPVPRSDQIQAGGPDTEKAPALRRWLDALGPF